MPDEGSTYVPLPIKVLRGIPNHWTYRAKLQAKWRRKGYSVHFLP